MAQAQGETLYDYKKRLDWLKKLKWNDRKLRQVPVHHRQTDDQPFLSLTEVDPEGLANLFIYKNEVPREIWTALISLVASLGPPSGYEQQGMEGTNVWEHRKGNGTAA